MYANNAIYANYKINDAIKNKQLPMCNNNNDDNICDKIAQPYFMTFIDKKRYIFCSEKCLLYFEKNIENSK